MRRSATSSRASAPRARRRARQGPAAGAGGARRGAELLRAERGVLICRTQHGFVCANAGVDQSNAPASRRGGAAAGGSRRLGAAPPRGDRRARGVRPAVLVSDSFGRAWRLGQVDVAIGAAGLSPLDDWGGRRDAAGRELRVTTIAVADAIAGAADLARAKDSSEPAVLVRGLERFVTPRTGRARRRCGGRRGTTSFSDGPLPRRLEPRIDARLPDQPPERRLRPARRRRHVRSGCRRRRT